MQESPLACCIAPHRLRGFQQREGPHDIGGDKGFRSEDRPVDVRLGGKVDHAIDTLVIQQGLDQRLIADIALHEAVRRQRLDVREALQVAGIGQQIEVDDAVTRMPAQPVANEVGADKAGAAGYKQSAHVFSSFSMFSGCHASPGWPAPAGLLSYRYPVRNRPGARPVSARQWSGSARPASFPAQTPRRRPHPGSPAQTRARTSCRHWCSETDPSHPPEQLQDCRGNISAPGRRSDLVIDHTQGLALRARRNMVLTKFWP